jgi:hypothetical protein
MIKTHNQKAILCKNKFERNFGAGVICEPWFTGSPEICELRKNVNLNSKFTGKMSELGSQKLSSQKFGSQKFGSRTLFVNLKKILLKNM